MIEFAVFTTQRCYYYIVVVVIIIIVIIILSIEKENFFLRFRAENEFRRLLNWLCPRPPKTVWSREKIFH